MSAADPELETLASTAFEARLRQAGASEFVAAIGYGVPLSITNPADEHRAVREAVGVMDFSFIRKLHVRGPDALAIVNHIVTKNVSGLEPGRISYSALVDDDGMMVDDVAILAYSSDHVCVTCGTEETADIIAEAGRGRAISVIDERDSIGHLCIQGPRSRAALQRLTTDDLSNDAFPYYSFRPSIEIAGITVHMNRMGFTAELGYEIWVSRDRAEELWDAVLGAAESEGGQAIAVLAVFMLRIEAAMVMGEGLDYDSTVSPYECRLGWTVDLDKGEFRGREALVALKDSAPSRLVTVQFPEGSEGLDGKNVLVGDQVVGRVTMSMPAPSVGGVLGLIRLLRPHHEVGSTVHVEASGEALSGQVIATPAYDPERLRVRS